MNLKLSIVNYQLSILLLLFFALPLKAQVTIGAQKAPHSYSVLELMSAKGLRLPMLSNDERDALNLTSDSTEAGGLVIYNTDIDCVEFWSDGKWIDLCSATPASSIVNSITLTSAVGTDAQTVCGNTAITPVTYATTGATGATFVGLPAGVTGSWDAGVVTISGKPTTSGNYIVVLTGGSGSGMAIGTITVNTAPQLTISGNNGVVKNATTTYSVTPISGVTNYTWTVSGTDWSIVSGQGSNSITATCGADKGTITVTAINSCGRGTASMDVKVGCPVKTTSGNWLTFMCYNLGATTAVQSLTPAQQTTYPSAIDLLGDLYQWGRVADGHQLRTSAFVVGPVTTFDVNGQAIGDTIGKYISGGDNPTYDWRTPQNNTLWYNNGKTVNDPCPDGWRVPTETEIRSILNGNSTQIAISPLGYTGISGNTWAWSGAIPGWLITPSGSSEPTLFLPAAGYRTSSVVANVGLNACYWTSSFDDVYAISMYCSSTGINPNTYSTHSCAYSVRCVAE